MKRPSNRAVDDDRVESTTVHRPLRKKEKLFYYPRDAQVMICSGIMPNEAKNLNGLFMN